MTKPRRSKSPQRILAVRLRTANHKPRAWAVAVVLEGYARLERGTGRRIASLYHEKIAEETGMSVGNVRRALVELTTGPHPLYRKRNATGRQHTIFGTNDWELTTTGAIYEWIDAPDADTAGRPQAATMRPARSGRGYKPTLRCLTASQVEQYAADVEASPSYGELLPDGAQRIAEYHALDRHVDEEGCDHCQLAVARQIAANDSERFEGIRLDDRCSCGAPVIRHEEVVADLWDFVTGNADSRHRCETAAKRVAVDGDRG